MKKNFKKILLLLMRNQNSFDTITLAVQKCGTRFFDGNISATI